MRAKSKKQFKLSLSRFHYSAWFLYFIRFQACYVACHPKASMSFKLQWLFQLKKKFKAQLLGGKIGLDETLSQGFSLRLCEGLWTRERPRGRVWTKGSVSSFIKFFSITILGHIYKLMVSLLTSHKIENTRRSAGDGGFAIHWIPGGCMAVERRVRLSS